MKYCKPTLTLRGSASKLSTVISLLKQLMRLSTRPTAAWPMAVVWQASFRAKAVRVFKANPMPGCGSTGRSLTRNLLSPVRASSLAEVVIHAVGPIWGSGDEQAKLAAAVRGCLERAEELNLTSISLPAISTGIFGFPKALAARIFFETIAKYYQEHPQSILRQVRLTLFDQPTLTVFLSAFNDWQRTQ